MWRVSTALLLFAAVAQAADLRPVTVTIRAAAGPVNTFVPSSAFGAGVDGREVGDAARTYTAHNLKRMRSAGFGPLTYRLRTELGVEAWHWNAKGRWSDPARARGYWTSSAKVSGELGESFGYRLPRRGSTGDQANNDGYSRIDDGDRRTFWKSNPYLDETFTHESADWHPQWIAVDFGGPTEVNAVRISWGEPFATAYSVEYCSDERAGDFSDQVPQCWVPFARGAFSNDLAAARVDVLAPKPVTTRFLRIVLTASCRCLSRRSTDVRDRVGYAVRELEAGVVDDKGRFHDAIRHGRTNETQTEVVVSSTDPWHTAGDRDLRTEQPGFDRVFASGLTSGQPMLVPVGVLYDTPENAAAEIAWLKSRGYPVTEVEMGEEPDGQYATPEDYAALYIQFAAAIHRVAPELKLGGPCFQTTVGDYLTMPLHGDNRTWLRRFLDSMARGKATADYDFFSFEWYPFDDVCAATPPQLAAHPRLLAGVLQRLQRDGLSRDIPWFISEYGYSAFAGRAEVDIEGALLNAETVGLFLTLGGDRAYFYGFEPNELMDELSCGSWGNNAMFLADARGQARAPTATYWGARLLTRHWVQPGHAQHLLFAADADDPLVSAFPVRRPDGEWGVLLVNKDPTNERSVTFRVDDRPAVPVDAYRYSREQYVWDAKAGRATRNDPPRHDTLPPAAPVVLPPYSLSVVRLTAR